MQRYQLVDHQLSEQEAYVHYSKFKVLEFGPAMHEDDQHL